MVLQKQMMAKFGSLLKFKIFALLLRMLTLRIEAVFMVRLPKWFGSDVAMCPLDLFRNKKNGQAELPKP